MLCRLRRMPDEVSRWQRSGSSKRPGPVVGRGEAAHRGRSLPVVLQSAKPLLCRACFCVPPRRWPRGGSCFVFSPESFNPAPLPAAARQGALSGMQADLVQDAGPLSSNKSDLASVFPAPRLPSGDDGDTSGVASSRAASEPGDGG